MGGNEYSNLETDYYNTAHAHFWHNHGGLLSYVLMHPCLTNRRGPDYFSLLKHTWIKNGRLERDTSGELVRDEKRLSAPIRGGYRG